MSQVRLHACGAAKSRANTRQALGEVLLLRWRVSLISACSVNPETQTKGIFVLGRNSSEQVRSPTPHFSIRRAGRCGTCCRELRLGMEVRQEPEVQP